jgi:hypothetical protein
MVFLDYMWMTVGGWLWRHTFHNPPRLRLLISQNGPDHGAAE